MMKDQRKPQGKTRWGLLLFTTLLLASMLLAACQSAAPAAPTAAPKPAAPTAAPAAPAATAAPAAPAATAAPAKAAEAKTVTVKVGFQPAYTGPVAINSEPQSQGMNDYMVSVNDQGGIPYKDPKTGETVRAKLDIVWEDNSYDTARILSIYNRQKGAGVKAMVTYGTASGVALADQVSKDKMPLLFIGAPNEAVLKPTPVYVTSIGNLYDWQGKSFAKWAKAQWKESRAPRLGIIYTDATWGLMATAGLPEFAQQLGWEVAGKEVVKAPLTDSSIEMKRLFGGKPDWIFTALTAGDMAVAMKDTARLGFKDQAKWVSFTYGFDPASFQKVADAETNGVNGWLYWAVETEKSLPGVAEAAAGAQKYRQRDLTNMYLQGWATSKVFVEGGIKGALGSVGFDALTPEAINTALHSIKNLDTGGLFPPANTTDARPFIVSKARLVQWQDHKINILTDWQEGSLQ